MRRIFPFLVLMTLAPCALAQDLSQAARTERERQAKIKNPPRVITNADVGAARLPVQSQSSAQTSAAKSSAGHPVDREGHDELYWSGKFLAAKQRISDLEDKQSFLESQIKSYHDNLLSRSDVYDREHLYPPLIEDDTKELDKTKQDITAARAALDDLYAQLRNSGAPAEWADSTLAEHPTPPEHPTRQYFLDQLKQLDDRFDALEEPYRVERFRLVNRRNPNKGESLHIDTSKLGLGTDPSLPLLDAKIAALEQQRQRARSDVIEQARAAGFYIP